MPLGPGIAGPLTAAAGNVAGGLVADALLGDTSYPEGGGIEGLTNSDPGKSGMLSAVQIDSTKSLEYFEKAAKEQEAKYREGLQYYEKNIEKASSQLQSAVAQAATTLGKLTYAGDVSTDQYLKMLGLNARSPSFQSPDAVGDLGPEFNDIAQEMRQAEKIQDPDQRAYVKSGIMWALNKTTENHLMVLENNKKAALAALGPRPDRAAMIAADPGLNSLRQGLKDPNALNVGSLMDIDTPISRRIAAPIKEYDEKYNATMKHWDDAIASYKSKTSSAIGGFNKNYQREADYFAYDPEKRQKLIDESNPELTRVRKSLQGSKTDIAKPTPETLPNTPGYKFSLQQGKDTVMAAAAAGGMLSSGNTLAAMDKYSQGLAQQVYAQEMGFYLEGAKMNAAIEGAVADIASNQYNAYMGQLTSTMGIGTTATMQTAANQIGLGSGLAGLSQNLAGAGMNTFQGIGDALAQSLYHQGDTFNSNQLANMAAQNEMIKTSAGLASQNAIQGGYLQLANNRFGAQQAGLAGMAAGINAETGRVSNGGWPTYVGGSGGSLGRWILG